MDEHIKKLLGGTHEDMLIAHQLIMMDETFFHGAPVYRGNGIYHFTSKLGMKKSMREYRIRIWHGVNKYTHLPKNQIPVNTIWDNDIILSYSGNLYLIKNALENENK